MLKISCERDKYLWIYNESGNRSYGKRNHGYFAYDIVENLAPKSLLDIGCGKGLFVEWAKTKNINAVGLDFATDYDVQADILNMPFSDKSFEMITAFDVLEHLLPEDLEQGLDKMFRVAKQWWIISIGYGPSKIRTPEGFMQLHPISTRDKSWWIPILSRYATIEKKGITRRGNPYLICNLKKEINYGKSYRIRP